MLCVDYSDTAQFESVVVKKRLLLSELGSKIGRQLKGHGDGKRE